MFINIDTSGTLNGFSELISNALEDGAKGIVVFSCDANDWTPQELDPILKNIEVPIFGGIFPQILYKNKKYEKGTAILCFSDEAPTLHTIKNISNNAENITACLEGVEEEFNTMFVFVDAFSTSIEKLIEALYFEFGLENNFIGGGAGSLSFVQKPVIITNEGVTQDSAVIATINKSCGIGVKHGWKSVKGSFQITKADKNTIVELDYKPAFEVYKEVVEDHSRKLFKDDNFFDIAKAYPFGISKIGSEKVVRDPIAMVENSLVCVGNVVVGDYVDILNSSTKELVEAASVALIKAQEEKSEAEITFFIDCISRVLFMEDDFQLELDAVAKDLNNLIGAMTLGEIANTGKEYLEFYNKTAVIGVL
ncbi:MAG: FIST N-terminal domain-containing protein [Campylobacterota bacterium]|nr:FIST N-terminal domain-containing protein [Campylobacterota bacterium]